jgi:hypothetical protein
LLGGASEKPKWTIKNADDCSHRALRGGLDPATFGRYAAVTIYRVTLRDRETQTVVGYYNVARPTTAEAPTMSMGITKGRAFRISRII